jgi:hypothetical protein
MNIRRAIRLFIRRANEFVEILRIKLPRPKKPEVAGVSPRIIQYTKYLHRYLQALFASFEI